MDNKKKTVTAVGAGLVALVVMIGGASIATGASNPTATAPQSAPYTAPSAQSEVADPPDGHRDGDCPNKGGGGGSGDGDQGSGEGSSAPTTPAPSTPAPSTPSTP